MRLIEGEELKQIVIGVWNDIDRYVEGDISLSDIIGIIDDMPTIEPEIIRCKDCKYHTHMWYCEAWNNSPGFPAVSDEMFCSLAERREDE